MLPDHSLPDFNNIPVTYLQYALRHNRTFPLLYTFCFHLVSQVALQHPVPRIMTTMKTLTAAYKILHGLDDRNQRNS